MSGNGEQPLIIFRCEDRDCRAPLLNVVEEGATVKTVYGVEVIAFLLDGAVGLRCRDCRRIHRLTLARVADIARKWTPAPGGSLAAAR